jgi:2-oxoglutarate ferredoxin oxidoreductase subunit alpha
MSLTRLSVKFAGESGQGINTVGKLLSKALNQHGYKTFSYREYPSLIKGGVASYQIDFSNKLINSSSRNCNILLTSSTESIIHYLNTVSQNGILIHGSKDLNFSQEQEEHIKRNNISVIYLDSVELAIKAGGTEIMSNAAILGFLWRILNLDVEILIEIILEHFKSKNIDLEAEKKVILAGHTSPSYRPELSERINIPKLELLKQRSINISGNDALSLGAISCGVRAYYGYPMTPATSIFKFLGNTANDTGILVKQAENEITAIHMAMGSMHMGTRALVATSGGGFDLMTETISCAGMTETPLVVVLSQRAGSGTGVPTWTGASDLQLAVTPSHGEFPRCVLSASDANSSYTLIQKAFNIAEQYQLPVILLTEKQISESIFSLPSLPKNIPIERGLSTGDLRYEITDSGISPRWIPSKDKKPYISNSDEHTEDGTSTDDSQEVIQMADKRARKQETLMNEIPEPTLYGSKNSEIVFVGWGSVKNVMTDLISTRDDITYLHYEYIYPLKTALLSDLIKQGKRLILAENNQTGQLGKLLSQETGFLFKEKVLKYDGRPFFLEDILDFLNSQ